MTESRAAVQCAIARLKADSTVQSLVGARVYANQAPESATYPFILVSVTAGRMTHVVGTARIASAPLLLVKGVDSDNDSRAKALDVADAIDAVLTATAFAGVFGDKRVNAAVLELPVDLSMTEKGMRYNHGGGQYRFHVSVT